jgi:hypothetical protein
MGSRLRNGPILGNKNGIKDREARGHMHVVNRGSQIPIQAFSCMHASNRDSFRVSSTVNIQKPPK